METAVAVDAAETERFSVGASTVVGPFGRVDWVAMADRLDKLGGFMGLRALGLD